MAARPKSCISIDTDVNLDFLTKEEKEALLSKKMDMIRQRNKALTERHQLIEADKKKAEDAGQAVKPTVDSQMLPAEGAPKPRGRGRGQAHSKDGNRPMKERPKSSGDLRDSSNYEPIVDTTDLANYRSKGHSGLHEREAPNNIQKSKKKSKEEGPPPDPSFNPLADRRRSDKKEDVVDHRRHPRNYGGTSDLSRVKQNMKHLREKEKERPQGSKPLDIVMTGKERRNHEDWKAERDRYDKERIQRQMSDGGNWKRAWDADKFALENEEQSAYSLKMEPAKRPAGRIGSGRFDRGERDDHPRSAVLVKGTVQHADHLQQQQQQWQHHDQQQLPAQLHQHHSLVGENKPARGRGRGRGRGRSRGGSGEKFPRPRTWSGGEDRFVECQKELLLVKFDNTAGDNSVEVEYDDDEFLPSPPNTSKAPQPATTQGRGPTGRTPNQASNQQARGVRPQQQKNKAAQHKDDPQINLQIPTEGQWNNSTPQTAVDQFMAAFGTEGIHAHTPGHSQGFRDGDEWEDDTETSAVQEENDSGISSMVQSSTTSSSIHDLHLECRLNPEAPEFLPTSADLIKSPNEAADTSPWNSASRSPSPLSQDSAFSPQLTPKLSTSPHTHPAIHLQESSAPLRRGVDTVLQNYQPLLMPGEESKVLARKQARVGDPTSSEVPKPNEKPEIIDVNVSCLTSKRSDTKDTIHTSNDVDRANALSDAFSKARKDALESNKAAANKEKTTSGNISASHPKRMTHNSLSEDTKNISKESATCLAAENTRDNVVAKDLLRDVSKMHGSSEGTTESITNGDGSDQWKLNGVSVDSKDHMLATHEHGVIAGSLKENFNVQEDLKTHPHAVAVGSLKKDSNVQEDLITHPHAVAVGSLKKDSNVQKDLITHPHAVAVGSLEEDSNVQEDLITHPHAVAVGSLKKDSNVQEDLITHPHAVAVGSLKKDSNVQEDLITHPHAVAVGSLKKDSNVQEDLITQPHAVAVGSLKKDSNVQEDLITQPHAVAVGSLKEDSNVQEDLTTIKHGTAVGGLKEDSIIHDDLTIHQQGVTVGSLKEDSNVHDDLTTHEHAVAVEGFKKDCNGQEDLKEPAATVTASISGLCDPAQVSELNGSKNAPKADESTLPTADICAFS
ncbi:unnamed protein product [Candidula unifasciata]|uniref:Uncharacterized protein n=1 Tax=Candidula unifasciata TaxID=100452 RepID=A0A8S3Z9E0_9EUPU|nr:unnamed protein product [Candidula unifasciata]